MSNLITRTAQTTSPYRSASRLQLLWSAESGCAEAYRNDGAAPYRVRWRIFGVASPAEALVDWRCGTGGYRLPVVAQARLPGTHAMHYTVTSFNGTPTGADQRALPVAGCSSTGRSGYGRQRASLALASSMGRLARRTRRVMGQAGAVLILTGAGLTVL